MHPAVRACVIATVASLAAVVAATVAAGPRVWLWAAWGVLAAVTVAVVVADRRKRA
jgi:hypothetical protein